MALNIFDKTRHMCAVLSEACPKCVYSVIDFLEPAGHAFLVGMGPEMIHDKWDNW